MAENSPRIEREPSLGDRRYENRDVSPRLESQRDRLLLEATELVVDGRRLPDLLEMLAPRVLNLTGCDFLKFALHDPRQNCMITYYWEGSQERHHTDAYAVDECISGLVWSQQEPLVIPDIEREQRFPLCMQQLRKLGIRSYVMLPLTLATRRFGALGLGRKVSQVLEPQELEFLSRVAFVVGLALENQRAHHATEEERERLQILVAIGRELSSTLDIENVIANILVNLRGVLRYDQAALMVLEEGGSTLRKYAADSSLREGQSITCDRVPLQETPSARAIATGSLVLWNAEELSRMETPIGKGLHAKGVQCLINVPLVFADKTWGSLNLASTTKNAYSTSDAQYLQQIANLIAAALRNSNSYHEVARLRDRLAGEKRYLENEIRTEMRWDEIVGKSPGLKRVLDYASIVAATDSTVLITGETGTGKERVARSIHSMSRRKDRSFIKVNCAAIPTGLLESELFGHEKGAFTGAVSQKIGRLELADKGTLFLDEIGEISLELQPKLLRVLQDQEFERLGGTRTIRVDARLIAATNRDLAQAVEEKQFRSDLFYRLHVFPLHLPALRDRREDIPMLVRHFVEKSSARLGRLIEKVPEEAMNAMLQWNWPGNIRELENFIERSVILSDGTVLRAPLSELRQEAGRQRSGSESTLEDRERDHIIEVLRHTRGVLSGPRGAAARLGLKRTTLQYKLQKLGIERTEYLE